MQKSDKLSENKLNISSLNFFDSVNALLAKLPQRAQEIVKKRFGLASGKVETLEKIGKDYRITRERVRQIICDVIKKTSKASEAELFKQTEEKIILKISESDGIISEESLTNEFSADDLKEANSIVFLLVCSNKIIEIVEKGLIKKSWALSKDILMMVKHIIDLAKEVLILSEVPITDAEIVEKIMAKEKGLSKSKILNFLSTSSEISKNRFNKWGLSTWMEINPKGTRERIYLILKEKKKPLHFMEIAKLIDEFGLSKRKAHPQTVHNELIKDDKFVLIGRGVYALREWGFVPGTIKDVLEDLLKKSGRAMTKDELLAGVLKVRQVKKTTIMINLNNYDNFKRLEGGKYMLKK